MSAAYILYATLPAAGVFPLKEAAPGVGSVINHVHSKAVAKSKSLLLSTLGRALLDHGLYKFFGTHLSGFEMEYNAFNKPRFRNSPIVFNISHAVDIAVCVLSTNSGNIGIDIEKYVARTVANFAPVFSGYEWQHIDTATDPEMSFYRYWVIKESVIKANGVGFDKMEMVQVPGNAKAYISDQEFHYIEIPVSDEYCCFLSSDKPLSYADITIEKIDMDVSGWF